MFLTRDDFSSAVNMLPLISIDFCILDTDNKLLLVKRNCRPAKGYLFSPGGRIRKNEKFSTAMERISKDEVGVPLGKKDGLIRMGIWDHFYEDSAFDENISTHYVNIPYFIKLNEDMQNLIKVKFGDGFQHDSFEWININECLNHKNIHKYSKEYAKYVYNNYI